MSLRDIRTALLLLLGMTLLLGVGYPLAVWAVARLAFPAQARGSLVCNGPDIIGSSLIGQGFDAPRYFWGRPSATTPRPYDGTASGGSNLGPLNPALIDKVQSAARALRAADPGNTDPIPVDLVTASASGLDPDISVAGARYQAGRVARERGIARGEVEALISRHDRGPWLGILGEPRVNVLELNLELDRRR